VKNECYIVRDLLPLYAEDMLSPHTKAFVAEHLQFCPECGRELESMEQSAPAPETKDDALPALRALKKKLRKKTLCTVLITVLVLSALAGALHFFPVYRLAAAVLPYPGWYEPGELSGLAYIGSAEDRAAAEPVMTLARQAFSDTGHTEKENREAYGALGIYSLSEGQTAVRQNFTLELWSAHFDRDSGCMWVYFTRECFDEAGASVYGGAYGSAALWTLQKNAQGLWEVTAIKQLPHGG